MSSEKFIVSRVLILVLVDVGLGPLGALVGIGCRKQS